MYIYIKHPHKQRNDKHKLQGSASNGWAVAMTVIGNMLILMLSGESQATAATYYY